MAVSLRSQGAASTTTSTSLTLTTPAGVQNGDYLIAFIHSQSSTAASDATSSGWSRVGAGFTPSDGAVRVTGFFAKVATGSEPGNYTFTMPTATSRSVGFIAAYTGVDTGNPVAFSSTWATSTSSNTVSVGAQAATENLFTLEIWAANYASPNSYALSSNTSGLTLLGEGFNPAGAENTGVSRSAMRVWTGTPSTGGLPSHSITTTGAPAQMAASVLSLNASGGGGGGGSLVTPTIIGHTTATASGASSSFTIDPETNRTGSAAATNDWILLVLTSPGNSAGTRQPTAAGGWTNIVPFATVGSGTMTFGVWAHKKTVGETTYSWTQTTAEANGTYQHMIFVRGADDIATWITGTFQNRATSGTTLTNVAPSVTATSAHTLGLLISSERTTAVETDPQVTCDNFIKQWFDNVQDHSVFVASKDMVSAGATGSVTVTYPNAHAQNGIAGIIGIPGTTATTSGLPIKVSNGSSLVDATFKLADGAGGFTTPGAYKVLRTGYASVTQMLAQNKFYCAHRGGSRDFPEMSLYAYGQSALLGYPALELSLARTSDGVWFGLHDASLDRTSFNTGGGSGTTYVASSMTWAQVQTYSILGSMAANNTGQPNRPYMRWEELMALYYPSHVIFVDPKVASAHIVELLNMMDAMPGTPTDHFVAKYYGVSGGASNTSGWNKEASQRGYKTWGYFYETDSANFATYAPRWDILGMDYSASQTAWNNLAAAGPGKPIMGHICPDAAAVATATTKGAAGFMISGVKVNTPPAIT